MLMVRRGIRKKRIIFLHIRGNTPRDFFFFFCRHPSFLQVSNYGGGSGDKSTINAPPVCGAAFGSNRVNCRPQLWCSDVSLARYIERKIGFKSVVPTYSRPSVVNHPERSAAIKTIDCVTP